MNYIVGQLLLRIPNRYFFLLNYIWKFWRDISYAKILDPPLRPTHRTQWRRRSPLCRAPSLRRADVLCMTAWHLKQHEQGRKHRNRVAYLAGEMNVRCKVCETCTSPAASTSSSTTPGSAWKRTYGCPFTLAAAQAYVSHYYLAYLL